VIEEEPFLKPSTSTNFSNKISTPIQKSGDQLQHLEEIQGKFSNFIDFNK